MTEAELKDLIARLRASVPCTACHGTGKKHSDGMVYDVPCGYCGGTGTKDVMFRLEDKPCSS